MISAAILRCGDNQNTEWRVAAKLSTGVKRCLIMQNAEQYPFGYNTPGNNAPGQSPCLEIGRFAAKRNSQQHYKFVLEERDLKGEIFMRRITPTQNFRNLASNIRQFAVGQNSRIQNPFFLEEGDFNGEILFRRHFQRKFRPCASSAGIYDKSSATSELANSSVRLLYRASWQ